MRTTIRPRDDLIAKAKKLAADTHRTLTAVIEDARDGPWHVIIIHDVRLNRPDLLRFGVQACCRVWILMIQPPFWR